MTEKERQLILVRCQLSLKRVWFITQKPSEDAEPPGEGDPQDQQISTEETTQPTESDKPSIEEKEEKEEEEEIDIDLTDPEVEKAAIKIQGGFKVRSYGISMLATFWVWI